MQENTKKEAIKREEAFAKVNQWQDGKMVQSKYLKFLILIDDASMIIHYFVTYSFRNCLKIDQWSF